MTIIELESGDTPKAVWDAGDALFKIQMKNRLDKLSVAEDDGEVLILEETPYGHRIMVRAFGDFEDGSGAAEWGEQFLSAIREEKETQP